MTTNQTKQQAQISEEYEQSLVNALKKLGYDVSKGCQKDEKIELLSQKLTAAEKRADYLERENARLNKLNGHLVAIHEGEE